MKVVTTDDYATYIAWLAEKQRRLARIREVAERAKNKYGWFLRIFAPPCIELCIDYVFELLEMVEERKL